MKFERKHAYLLIAVAIWNFSSGEDRPAGYWIAHTVLIVVNVIIGVVLGGLGLRALRRAE
jgi:hypothetical protein